MYQLPESACKEGFCGVIFPALAEARSSPGSRAASAVCPELALEISSLGSDCQRLPRPHEEMKDLATYIKVANSAIHEVPSGMLVLTLNLKQTAKLAS